MPPHPHPPCALLDPSCSTIFISPSAVITFILRSSLLFSSLTPWTCVLPSQPSSLPPLPIFSIFSSNPPPTLTVAHLHLPAELRRVSISLIRGVRMQFHLSSPLHSSAAHSITFRCPHADEAVLVGWEEGMALMTSRCLQNQTSLIYPSDQEHPVLILSPLSPFPLPIFCVSLWLKGGLFPTDRILH